MKQKTICVLYEIKNQNRTRRWLKKEINVWFLTQKKATNATPAEYILFSVCSER